MTNAEIITMLLKLINYDDGTITKNYSNRRELVIFLSKINYKELEEVKKWKNVFLN